MSGILLGKTMGRGDELADRFESDSLRLADLEVRQRMAGPLGDGLDPDELRDHARGGLLVRRPRAGERVGRRSRSRCSWRSRRCRRGSSSRSAPARGRPRRADVARAVRPDLRVPRPAGRHRGEAGRASPTASAGDVVFDRVWFRYGEDWTLQDVSFTVPAGTTTALVGETGSGKTTLGYLAARLYDVSRGRVTIGGVDIRDLSFAGAVRPGRRRLAGDLPLPRVDPREPALRQAGRHRRGDRGRRPTRRASTT